MNSRSLLKLALVIASGASVLAAGPRLRAQESDSEETKEQSSREPSETTRTGWAKTFAPEALPLVEKKKRYIVVTARGEADAGEALRKSLEKAGVAMTMKGASVADMSGWSDEKILKKTEKLPVDRVVIIRVTDMKKAPMAVVTVYKSDGSTVGGYTARRGQTVEKKGSASPSGLTQETVSSAQEAVESEGDGSDGDEEDDEEPDERYELEYRSGERQLHDYRDDSTATGEAIYTELGLGDLADQYEKNVSARKTQWAIGHATWGTGVAMLGAGSYFVYRSQFPLDLGPQTVGGPCSQFDNERVKHNCRLEQRREELTTMRTAGFAVAGAGVAAIVTGIVLFPDGSPHPLSRSELGKRVDQANDRAKEKKNKGKQNENQKNSRESEGAKSPSSRLRIVPIVVPRRGGGLVSVRLRF